MIVVSYGGVGTTFLLDFISNFRRTNCRGDTDGLKHLPIPPVAGGNHTKCVYVYGDPILATISLFRRGFHHAQSVKLLRYTRPRVSPISKQETLAGYAASGVDRFMFRRHLCNWHSRYLTMPTLFVRYDTLWDNIETLVEFLELPEGSGRAFSPRRVRESRPDEIDERTVQGLQSMYGAFAEDLKRRKDVEVREPAGPRRRNSFLLSPEYREAWKGHLLFTVRREIEMRAPTLHGCLKSIRRRIRKSG